MRRPLLAVMTAALVVLAACDGSDGSDDSDGGAPGVAPSTNPSSEACLSAMVASLSNAYKESVSKPPGEERDLAFAAAAGQLPSACRLIDSTTLKALLDQATQEAIPPEG